MVRIGNKEVPENKNILTGLTNIYGIGKTTAQRIISDIGIDYTKKVRSLNLEEIKSINKKLEKFPTEEELKREIQKKISEQIRLGTYQGLRRSRKPNPLPIHGQRTRANARTAKGHGRKTVAGKKKAPTAK